MSLIVVEKNLDMNILFDTNLQQRPYIFFYISRFYLVLMWNLSMKLTNQIFKYRYRHNK